MPSTLFCSRSPTIRLRNFAPSNQRAWEDWELRLQADPDQDFTRYRDDPDGFNREVLGRPDYWSKQVEICEAVVRRKTVIVPTGNSVGKSYCAAGLILWWVYTHPGSLVVTTALSQTLLGTVLFKEIRRAKASSKTALPGRITDSPNVSPQTLLVDGTGWGVLGIATCGVERLSGQHNPNLL